MTKLVKDTLWKDDGVHWVIKDTLVHHYPKQGFALESLDTIISYDNIGYMYLYRGADGSILYTDIPIDSIHEDVPEPVVVPVIRFADTVKASTKEFKTFTSFEPHYYNHGVEKKDANNYDSAVEILSLPILVLLTFSYLHRVITKNSWGNFIKDLQCI